MPILNSKIEKIKFKPIKFKPPKQKKTIHWFWNSWRWIKFWYDQTSNGIYGPGGKTYLHFRTGKLALIISILALILIIIMFIKIVF